MPKAVSKPMRSRAAPRRRRQIAERQQLELSVRDSWAFVEELLNSKPVNDRLRETVRRYREATGV
ncbi:MAG TPA: DUF1778 domain-containing protein [Xanthobacteraceae bacterium]|nr:DUF1778 domain-containing protein [Xanthobacteraceae bacterium]